MGKFSKVYLRNKKQSNVSSLLRFNFLKAIFIEGLSVKNAASKWNMHYSTAKIIARLAKRSNQGHFFQNQTFEPMPTKQCNWREILPSPHFEESQLRLKDQSRSQPSGSSTESLSYASSLSGSLKSQIQVISTIGWTYLTINSPAL